MALLPTLSAQIFKEMDVEATRQELKQVIEGAKDTPAPASAPAPPADAPETHGAPQPPTEAAQETPAAEPRGGLDRLSEAPPPPISSEARLPAVGKPAAPPTDEERRHTKLRLWNEIKLQSFARTFTTLYTLVFLALQTHIQLNIIGRRAYLVALESQARRDQQQRLAEPLDDEKHRITLHDESDLQLGSQLLADAEDAGSALLDQDTEKKYLTSSYWFLHRGWRTVAERVQHAMHAEVGDMPLRTILTYHHFQGVVERIRERLEGSPDESASRERAKRTPSFLAPHGFRNLLLPERAEDECAMLASAGAVAPGVSPDEALTPQLRVLLDETKDFIDSPDFARVFAVSCDRVFELLMHHLAPSFGVQAVPDDLLHSAADARHRARALAAEKPLELARLLPLVALQAQVAFNTSPNEYVETITESRELRAFSVLTYTAWGSELAP